MRATSKLGAAATAAGLLLAACGGGGGDLPDDPKAAVAQAAENTFSDGSFSITVGADISDELIDRAEAEDQEAAKGLSLLRDDPLTVEVDGDKFAATLKVEGEEFVAVRYTADAIYLRFNFDAAGPLVDPAELEEIRGARDQIAQFGGAEGPFGPIAGLAEAFFEGDWVGVTELPEDAGEQVGSLLGGFTGSEMNPGEVRAQLDAAGFGGVAGFIDAYVDVTGGEDGAYDASLQVRELATAFNDLAAGFGEPIEELPADAPDEVTGLRVLTDGDQLSALEIDLRRLVDGLALPAEDMAEFEELDVQEGDAVFRVSFSGDGSVSAPGDAETITWDQVQTLLSSFLGGGFGG